MASGNFDPELVERVVREVIRRLLDHGVNVTNGDGENTDRELTLNENVVALATLDGKLDCVKRIRVGSKAVVTPAVKDELKERGIELVRQA